MVNKLLNILKELRLFIGILIATGWISAANPNKTLEYIYTYNIHLVIIIVIGVYINHYLSSKRHTASEKRTDLMQSQLNDVIHKSNVDQIRYEIKQAYKEYHDIEVIDFVTTIRYLRGLNERRVSLGINSYTEDMMNILLNKIQIGVE